MKESIIYYSVRAFGVFIRCLPVNAALWIGKGIGVLAYYFDIRHKSQAYANLKRVFAGEKSPNEIKRVTKELFKNYGQNIIEIFRMPLLSPVKFDQVVAVEGKEHITQALKEGKGAIILAMHFGSWEMASSSCAMMGYPYKFFVKPQEKHSRLDDLLNSYRACGGSVVISRGIGTRDFVRSLKNNEVIGMVVDQGGRDGALIPFFGRRATLSVGAIRMGLKLGVPICFSAIVRQKGGHHKMVIHPPFALDNTGRMEEDVVSNLKQVTKVMEEYIRAYPAEYMWFYKIWKYSDEADIVILSDGKTGHLRQSQAVARMTARALSERSITARVQTVPVIFKHKFAARLFSLVSAILPSFVYQGRLESLKWFLTPESFARVAAMKADFIVSCGSSTAGVNNLLSRDSAAKSIVILKPGLLPYGRFDWVVLPHHDAPRRTRSRNIFSITRAAPNLITPEYLDDQARLLLNRYSHLKGNLKPKIGLLIGGDAKTVFLSERQIRIMTRQIKDVQAETGADILITTSRRTPVRVEQILWKEFGRQRGCPLLIVANREDVPEAVGGILGLSDVVVVSGDSLSMISEAAASGKNAIVLLPQTRTGIFTGNNKHLAFIAGLNARGIVLSSSANGIGQSIHDMLKGKIRTRTLEDNDILLEAARKVI